MAKVFPTKVFLSSVVILLLVSSEAFAHQLFRPRNDKDLSNAKMSDFIRVADATVAWADYNALRRDFSALQNLSDAQIDTWIVNEFAYVSRTQLLLQDVRNTHIPTEPKPLRAFRLPEYHRTAVFRVAGGLVDLKGVGLWDTDSAKKQAAEAASFAGDAQKLQELQQRDHSDGLMSLGEAVAEVTRQRAVQALFDIDNVKNETFFETIESYFVISLPFEILKGGGEKIPAAIYGRQSNFARLKFYNNPPETYLDKVGGRQHDAFGAAVDFGAVHVTDTRLNETFGGAADAALDVQKSRAWSKAHDAAKEYFYGQKTDSIRKHIDEMLAPIAPIWEATKPTADTLRIANLPKKLASYLMRTALLLCNLGEPRFRISGGSWPIFLTDAYLLGDVILKGMQLLPEFVPEDQARAISKVVKERFAKKSRTFDYLSTGSSTDRQILTAMQSLGHQMRALPSLKGEALSCEVFRVTQWIDGTAASESYKVENY